MVFVIVTLWWWKCKSVTSWNVFVYCFIIYQSLLAMTIVYTWFFGLVGSCTHARLPSDTDKWFIDRECLWKWGDSDAPSFNFRCRLHHKLNANMKQILENWMNFKVDPAHRIYQQIFATPYFKIWVWNCLMENLELTFVNQLLVYTLIICNAFVKKGSIYLITKINPYIKRYRSMAITHHAWCISINRYWANCIESTVNVNCHIFWVCIYLTIDRYNQNIDEINWLLSIVHCFNQASGG